MSNSEIELRSIFAVLRRQIRVIGMIFALIFGLAGLYLLTVTPTYTATALVLVDPAQKNLLDPSQPQGGSAGSDNARVDSEVEILRSDAVGLAVIAAEGLIADPEFGPHLSLSEKLARAVGIAHAAEAPAPALVAGTLARVKEAVSVRRRGLTYLIAVAATSQDPDRAAELANAMTRNYIRQQVEAKITGSLAARDALQDQITAARSGLAESEAAFEAFLDRNIARIAAETGRADIAALHTDLIGLRAEISQQTTLRAGAAQALQAADWQGLAKTLGDEALARIGAERQALADRLSEAPDTLGNADLRGELARLEAEAQDRSAAALAELGDRIGALDRSATQTRTDLRQRLVETELSPDLLAEIFTVQQQSGIARTQYQTLLARLSDVEAQARMQLADARIVSPALTPASASFPNKALVLLAAFGLATGLGVSTAFLKEYYIGGVTSALQLSEILQAPAATSLPFTPEHNEGRFSVAERIVDAPLSVYAESVRKLRAVVDQAFRAVTPPGSVSRGRVVLVSSAQPGEGKTTTALALARTYALAGKRTLLIDADLRMPSLHRQLGFEPDVGFLDYLRNPEGSEISGSFYARDPASPLALIMGAGRSDIPTDQLLNSATFEALLDQARDVYDITIIDSPPLLPIVDARYIAHNADAVVLVVRWAATSQSDLRAAVQPLRDAMRPEAALVPVLNQQAAPALSAKYDPYGRAYSAAI